MFQQRHFIVIVAWLRNDTGLTRNSQAWNDLVDSMVATMARHNAKFKRAVFLKACGAEWT